MLRLKKLFCFHASDVQLQPDSFCVVFFNCGHAFASIDKTQHKKDLDAIADMVMSTLLFCSVLSAYDLEWWWWWWGDASAVTGNYNSDIIKTSSYTGIQEK